MDNFDEDIPLKDKEEIYKKVIESPYITDNYAYDYMSANTVMLYDKENVTDDMMKYESRNNDGDESVNNMGKKYNMEYICKYCGKVIWNLLHLYCSLLSNHWLNRCSVMRSL